MKCYPNKTDPITISKLSGEWADHGTPQEIVPSGVICKDIKLKKVYIHNISTIGYYEIKIYYGNVGSEKCISTIPFSMNNPIMDYITLDDGAEIIMAGYRVSSTLTGGMAGASSIKIKIGFEDMEED